MDERVWIAAISGLLHDIGKFRQWVYKENNPDISPNFKTEKNIRHGEASASFVDQYTPHSLAGHVLDIVRKHSQSLPQSEEGQPGIPSSWAVRLADLWSCGITHIETETGKSITPMPYLVPILSHLELSGSSPTGWQMPVAALELNAESIFPNQAHNVTQEKPFTDLWEKQFLPEIARWQAQMGEAWETYSSQSYFTTLLNLFHKFLSNLPSSSPWNDDEDDALTTDVSLYHHLRTTSAIAAVLSAGFSDEDIMQLEPGSKIPVAVMVRGDFSGIQNWIFRITRPETDASFDGVTKRLRGRSFHLAILGEVIAEWLVNQFGLPESTILFAGGGRFDILLPRQAASRLPKLQREMEDWLLNTFYGELNLELAWKEVIPVDFTDMQPIYAQLDHLLEQEKQHKLRLHLDDPGFLISSESYYHACPVCRAIPVQGAGVVCDLCQLHHRLGKKLPDTSWVVLMAINLEYQWPAGCETIRFEALNLEVGLLNDQEADQWSAMIQSAGGPAKIFRINDTAFLKPIGPSVGIGYRFLANEAPLAREDLIGGETVRQGNVLHFEAIARLSTGASRIAVLKADVDHLGLLFGEGLRESAVEGLRPSISRLASLSEAMNNFFLGWLNRICQQVFDEWLANQLLLPEENRHPWHNKVDGLFYILYAGGDDLFIIGPWDTIHRLAQKLDGDFASFACQNPDVTLSAGVVQVKPHFPVQRLAVLAETALKASKNAGRDRITAFNVTMPWQNTHAGYAAMMKLSDKLYNYVQDDKVPRTFIHDLGRLFQQHRDKNGNGLKPLWEPRLYYLLARRLEPETAAEIKDDIFHAISDQLITFPVSYVSLATRKE